MPFSAKDTAIYREDVQADGKALRAKDREELLKVRQHDSSFHHNTSELQTNHLLAIPSSAA